MMMMKKKKALGSSRSFSLVGVLGSEQWRSVSNFPGLGGLLAAAETSLRSYFLALLLLFLLPDR